MPAAKYDCDSSFKSLGIVLKLGYSGIKKTHQAICYLRLSSQTHSIRSGPFPTHLGVWKQKNTLFHRAWNVCSAVLFDQPTVWAYATFAQTTGEGTYEVQTNTKPPVIHRETHADALLGQPAERRSADIGNRCLPEGRRQPRKFKSPGCLSQRFERQKDARSPRNGGRSKHTWQGKI